MDGAEGPSSCATLHHLINHDWNALHHLRKRRCRQVGSVERRPSFSLAKEALARGGRRSFCVLPQEIVRSGGKFARWRSPGSLIEVVASDFEIRKEAKKRRFSPLRRPPGSLRILKEP
jgi:hypothetical protein